MVTEDYVSFEIAKLLKEKEFNADVNCTHVYVYGRVVSKDYVRAVNESEEYVQAPTLQVAMKWLREVHNIAVSVYVFNRDLPIKENGIRYTCDIATTKISSKEGHLRLTGTYEEACEAAIKYCLENLV